MGVVDSEQTRQNYYLLSGGGGVFDLPAGSGRQKPAKADPLGIHLNPGQQSLPILGKQELFKSRQYRDAAFDLYVNDF